MDNTTAYLAVLARIMQEERAETTTGSWEHYEKLYALVHTDLTTQLKASRYPDAPALQKKAEGLLDEMEPLYLCPELAGTGCLLISDYHTNTLFEPFRRAFLHWADIAPLLRLQTQIPFLIVDSEEDQLEVLNYANRHVALSPDEYELLLTESGKNRVALNKIVQVFLLRTPLAVKNVSLIFDNVYHRAEQLFGGAVSRKIACLNSRGFQTASKRGLDHFDAVTCKPELVPALKAHPALCHCPRMDWAMLVPCLSTIHPILYGFQYRFQALFTQMECYYLRSSNEMQEVVRQITDDIVRLGEKQNDALPQLRQSAKEAGDQLNNEWNALQPVLETIHTCLTENEKDLRDLSSSGKEVPRRVWDAVFEIFFTEEREKTRFGQKIEASLRTLEYPELPLVQAYLKKKAGKPVSAPVVTVGPGEWEKARMLLELQNPDSLSRATLRQYVDLLKPNRLSSGREYYAKSLIATFPEDVTSALTESFQRGYLPAGEKLLQLYNCAPSSIDLSVLVNGLLPEACVAMAQRSTPRCVTYSDLADPGFAYYKLAAVKGYLPAIQFIVDKLYDSGFSTAKRIGSTSLTDAARKNMQRTERFSVPCATISSRNAAISHCTTARFLVWCCSAWANPIPRPCACFPALTPAFLISARDVCTITAMVSPRIRSRPYAIISWPPSKASRTHPCSLPCVRAIRQMQKKKKNRLPPIRRETATNAQRPTTRLTTVAALSQRPPVVHCTPGTTAAS